MISNNTADTFSIPKKILPGPINSHINLGYEILYIDDCGDTSDLTENLYEDIQYNYPLPWNTKANITLPRNENQNMYSLFPGKARMIEQYISDNLLEKRGNYLLRFSIKKETLFHNDINFSDDLRSE
ncbi:MAG TPA: hypothetical protein VK484_05540, partial [Ferruginibacter sp.]|nr:hypothetical protein [Ferruginibacter sp.]